MDPLPKEYVKGILKGVTSVGRQPINHSALVSWIKKQSAIFSLLLDDPNLPVSPLVPADSNKAGERVVFSTSHFLHQQNSIAKRGTRELRKGAHVYSYLLHLDVLSNTMAIVSTLVMMLKKLHAISSLLETCRR